jgi:hypothetical protein
LELIITCDRAMVAPGGTALDKAGAGPLKSVTDILTISSWRDIFWFDPVKKRHEARFSA